MSTYRWLKVDRTGPWSQRLSDLTETAARLAVYALTHMKHKGQQVTFDANVLAGRYGLDPSGIYRTRKELEDQGFIAKDEDAHVVKFACIGEGAPRDGSDHQDWCRFLFKHPALKDIDRAPPMALRLLLWIVLNLKTHDQIRLCSSKLAKEFKRSDKTVRAAKLELERRGLIKRIDRQYYEVAFAHFGSDANELYDREMRKLREGNHPLRAAHRIDSAMWNGRKCERFAIKRPCVAVKRPCVAVPKMGNRLNGACFTGISWNTLLILFCATRESTEFSTQAFPPAGKSACCSFSSPHPQPHRETVRGTLLHRSGGRWKRGPRFG